MGIRPTSFDWNHVRAFLATAEAGTFSRAAKALGSTQPTLGRQIAALEASLGLSLFERRGRRLVPTSTGLELLEHVRAMSEAALHVERVAEGQSVELRGPVRLSASEVVTAHLLPPVVSALRAQHPGIELELVVTDAPVDLRQREADLAVRHFRPSEPDLVARKLRDAEGRFYATPGYLRSLGGSLTRAEAPRATFVGFDRAGRFRDGLVAMGLLPADATVPVVTSSQLAQWALVHAGVGVGVMMAEVGDRDPAVVRVFEDVPAMPVPIWLVTHREVHTSRRLRVVADLVTEHLGRAPA